jgi:hypothetical protein
MHKNNILLTAILVVLITACTNIGPRTIPRDRFDYNAAISDSWKEQTLLNIVKTRYADMPLFVEVASVVSGYTLESSANIGVNQSSGNVLEDDTIALGGSTKFTDRPTITYAPVTGSRFNKSFMTPIPPRAVLFLVQSGWPLDMVFSLTVESINGLRSQVAAGASARTGDEGYYRAIELLRDIQLSGATGMQIRHDEFSNQTALLIFYKTALSDAAESSLSEVSKLLGLSPELNSAVVKYGYLPSDDSEITLLTRSMLQLMALLSTHVDVPPEHVAEGRTVPSSVSDDIAGRNSHRILQISSSEIEPEDPFVAVRYRDYWYWIDDRDFDSKRIFSFVMILFSLTESGENIGMPLVTIPTG